MCPQPPSLIFPLGDDVAAPSTPYDSSTPSLLGLYLVHGGPVPIPPPPPSSLFPPCPRCPLECSFDEINLPEFFCPHRHQVAFPYVNKKGAKIVHLKEEIWSCFGCRGPLRLRARTPLDLIAHVEGCLDANKILEERRRKKKAVRDVGVSGITGGEVEEDKEKGEEEEEEEEEGTTGGGELAPAGTPTASDSISFDLNGETLTFTAAEIALFSNVTLLPLPALSPSTSTTSVSSSPSTSSDAPFLLTPIDSHQSINVSYFTDILALVDPDHNQSDEDEVEVEETKFAWVEEEEGKKEEEEEEWGFAWLGLWWSMVEDQYK